MAREVRRQRSLPHWDVPHAAYFVTTCLEGSIPAQGKLDLIEYRNELSRRARPDTVPQADWSIRNWKLQFSRTEDWLDLKPSIRHLADERLAEIVVDGFLHFAGERYDLLAFVVMLSRIHWVFRPLVAWVESLGDSARTPRERIVHSLNRHTAGQCNAALGLTGEFWQHESYDHWIRDEDELERIIRYIENNPVKAGLCGSPREWRFSSAAFRADLGLEFGEALI